MTRQVEDASGRPLQTLFHRRTQRVTVSAVTAVPAAALFSDTTTLRVVCTVSCHYKIDVGTPTATTNDAYLPAGVVEYPGRRPNETIAFIRAAGETDGFATVTES